MNQNGMQNMGPRGNSEEPATYQAVRIGDIADWRLIVVISGSGMSAYLKNSNPTADVVTLFEERWATDPDTLLSKIEAAVYDHPQVLDDFTANIAVVAPKAIWAPIEYCPDEDAAAELYTAIYSTEPDEVMADEEDDMQCLYTLVPGLKGFLQRTFPGARVNSHFSILKRRFADRSADMQRVYIDIRDGEADFVVFDNARFLMAATHPWHAQEDMEYHLFNILDVYGLAPEQVQVSLSGKKEIKTDLMVKLRERLQYVMLTMIPSISAKANMPLAAALLLRN